jgi:hypothetical protein
MKERKQCACRGTIEVELDAEKVAAAVHEHQRKPEHRLYVDRMVDRFADFPVASLPRTG